MNICPGYRKNIERQKLEKRNSWTTGTQKKLIQKVESTQFLGGKIIHVFEFFPAQFTVCIHLGC